MSTSTVILGRHGVCDLLGILQTSFRIGVILLLKGRFMSAWLFEAEGAAYERFAGLLVDESLIGVRV